MAQPSLLIATLLLGVASLFHLAGCRADPAGGSCTESTECGADEICVDEMCVPRGDSARPDTSVDTGPGPTLVSLMITPADPVLTSIDGDAVAVDFGLEASWSDGTTAPVSTGFWELGAENTGTIDAPTGVFTARGDVGGIDTVIVDALGSSATTTVTVNLELNVIDTSAPADAPTRFGSEVDDGARSAGLLYPLDATVFPQNVYPPDVQWDRGNDGDLYRVTFTSPRVTLRGYVLHSGGGFGYDWAVPRDSWRALAESGGGEEVTLSVDRWDSSAGDSIRGLERTFRFADASITGSIYYWDLGSGRILRIRGDGTGLERFLDSPPARGTTRCIACHTISRDGRRMAAEIWDASNGFGAVYDLTVDLSSDPPPAIVPPSVIQFVQASFNPDASRLIASWRNDIFLIDGNTGARLTPSGTPLPTAASGQPEWSPDGASIAYVTNHNGTFWAIDFTASDLGIIPVTGTDSFGPSTVIRAGMGMAIARPSWSPDSQWIAVQYGTNSRSNNSGTQYPATLQLVSADGAIVNDLSALNGGAEDSYYPTFSPFDEGGYFWLAFFSSRDYGNAQVGTRGTGRRQLWVSAVSRDPGAAVDPSNPPYWLPQQDVTRQNMAAFWSEEACRADGRSCSVSAECCSGFCRDLGTGPECVPPDVPSCSMTGEACRDDSDCCADAGSCASNVCTTLG